MEAVLFLLIVLLLLLSPLALWWRSRRQERRLQRLEAEGQELRQTLRALQERLAGAGIGLTPPSPSPTPKPSPNPSPSPSASASSPPRPASGLAPASVGRAGAIAPAIAVASPLAPPQPRQRRVRRRPELWQRVERLLIDHWTGILGVLVVVAGLTFLAINLALRLGPFERFLLLLAAAAVLAAPSLLAGRRPGWQPLAGWLRSGAAALLLFACAASSALPELGLQWIHQPLPALALLSLGMGVNLGLAALAGSESRTALHVVLNLVPLALVPASGFSLVLASTVALFGQLLPGRRPWPAERLMVGLAYGLFLLQWCGVLDGASAFPAIPAGRALTIGAGLAVFAAGAVLPQATRPGQGEPPFTPLALIQQLLHWGGLALVLLLLPEPLLGRLGGLGGAALAALLLGWRAHRLGWTWLRRSNLLIGQTLVLAALNSLDPLLPDGLLLLLAVLVESALFLRLGLHQGDRLLQRVGWGLAAGSGGLLLLGGVDAANSLQASSVLLIAGGVTTKLQRDLSDERVPQPIPGLLSWWAALQFLVGAMVCGPAGAGAWLALGCFGTLMTRSRRPLPLAQPAAVSAAVLLSHLIGWGQLLHQLGSSDGPLPPGLVMGQLTPLLLLACILVVSGHGRRLGRQLGIHLIGGSLLLGAALLLGPIAALLPALTWLLLSLVALETTRMVRSRQAAVAVLQQGLLALGIGLIATAGADPSPWRLGSEALAIGVLLRWWCLGPAPGLVRLPPWRRLHPYLLELTLLAVALPLARELPPAWQGPGWLLLALALLSPAAVRLLQPRVQAWSVLASWIAIALVMLRPHEQPLLTISLAIAYVVVSHRWLRVDLPSSAERGAQAAGPAALAPLDRLTARLGRAADPLLCYPLFLAIAVVLASHYDRSLLTLLLALEAFAIYVLSAVLRDGQFRAVALIALGGCLWRLVVVDMAQADLTTRGLVFVGVGLLMLAMNGIASRYRGRFR